MSEFSVPGAGSTSGTGPALRGAGDFPVAPFLVGFAMAFSGIFLTVFGALFDVIASSNVLEADLPPPGPAFVELGTYEGNPAETFRVWMEVVGYGRRNPSVTYELRVEGPGAPRYTGGVSGGATYRSNMGESVSGWLEGEIAVDKPGPVLVKARVPEGVTPVRARIKVADPVAWEVQAVMIGVGILDTLIGFGVLFFFVMLGKRKG